MARREQFPQHAACTLATKPCLVASLSDVASSPERELGGSAPLAKAASPGRPPPRPRLPPRPPKGLGTPRLTPAPAIPAPPLRQPGTSARSVASARSCAERGASPPPPCPPRRSAPPPVLRSTAVPDLPAPPPS